MGGVTLALQACVGAQWEQGCPSLLLGHSPLDCACLGDARILPALLRGSAGWAGAGTVFPGATMVP